MPEDSERGPSLTIVGGRKRGRPAVGEPIKITLPTDYVDKLFSLAHDRGESVSALVRQMVILRLKEL
jgi:hypothetical protein